MKEYFIYKRIYKGALNSTLLAKSLHQKLWDDSPYLLKQLPGIGMVTAKALHSIGVNSFETFLDAEPRKIEIVTGRKYPFGNHIKESLQSLPPKVEMRFENVCQKQGRSKLVVTLTRLSHSTVSTKRHYADMMVGIGEDDIILFHERIRVDEFLSPYSATILLPGPRQGKRTVNADLLFDEFVGIDIRQSMTVKDIDLYGIHKEGSKYPSTSRVKDMCTTEDGDKSNNCSYKAPFGALCSSNESERPQEKMPSFKLLDEESEGDLPLSRFNEGAPAVETEDDECMILTEKTVFDHIREKVKNLPSLEWSSNTCCPSPETLTLIRKRTRERRLELEDTLEISEGNAKNKVLHRDVVIPNAETVGSNAEKLLQVPESLTEETIFDHIRRKANAFPLPDNLKTTELKFFLLEDKLFLQSKAHWHEGTLAHKHNQILQDSEIHSNPDKGISEGKDMMFCESSQDVSHRVIISSANRRRMSPVTNAKSNQHKPCSPLLHPQCSSFITSGDIREENSFLEFKSIFSFL